MNKLYKKITQNKTYNCLSSLECAEILVQLAVDGLCQDFPEQEWDALRRSLVEQMADRFRSNKFICCTEKLED